jgi:hypothetical protein
MDLRRGILEQLRIQSILEKSDMQSLDGAIYDYLQKLGVASSVKLTEKGDKTYDVVVEVGGEELSFEVTLRG